MKFHLNIFIIGKPQHYNDCLNIGQEPMRNAKNQMDRLNHQKSCRCACRKLEPITQDKQKLEESGWGSQRSSLLVKPEEKKKKIIISQD